MKLRLYHYWRSSSSWRVRWALALKKIECEFVTIDLLKGEEESENHRGRNPTTFVPVLELVDQRSPLKFLGESMAIIEWLEEFQPLPSLLPGDGLKRARLRQLSEIINAGTQPLQNLGVAQHHSSDTEEQKRWNQHWTRRGLQAYELLVGETAGRFSMGNSVTLADLFLIPHCYNAGRQEVSLGEFPTIKRIYEAALETASCQASAPEKYQPKSP